MRTLLVLISFVFALNAVQGQGYARTRLRKVVPPKTIIRPITKHVTISKQVIHHEPKIAHKPAVIHPPVKPVDPFIPTGPIGGISDGPMIGDADLPPAIRNLIGKTITGNDIIGGQGRFPVHGGAGPNQHLGLRNGWGADPNEPMNPAVSGWVSPTQGRPFDPDFTGGELVFDPNRGMYVASGQIHHQAKKTGSMIGSPSIIGEHNMVKEASMIAQNTIAGGGIGTPVIGKKPGAGSYIGLLPTGGMSPVGPIITDTSPIALDHQIAKSSGIGPAGHAMAKATSGIGMGAMGHSIAKATMLDVDPFGGVGVGSGSIQHDIAKSSGIGGMGIQHDIAKSTGMGAMGGISIQHDIAKSTGMGDMGGMDIQHGIIKSTGMGDMGGMSIQHGIAKSTGMGDLGGIGIQHGIVKSTGMGDMGIQHNIAKSTGLASAVDPFGPPAGVIGNVGMQHDIVKATSGIIDPVGPGGIIGSPVLPPVKKAGGNPVHNVEKVIQSGVATINHDNLAANIGSQIAREVTRNAARTIDIGSGGAARAGHPIAHSAIVGLAKESMHVADEIIGIASGKRGHQGEHIIAGDRVVGSDAAIIGGPGAMVGIDSVGIAGHPGIPVEPIMPVEPMLPAKPITIVKPVIPKKPKVPKYMRGGDYSRNPGRRRGWREKNKGKGKGRRPFKGPPRMRAW